jgi:hypothetical protein
LPHFYFYALGDGEEADEQIEIFKNWFHHSFDGKPDWQKP